MRVLNSLSDLNILRILNLIWRAKKISRIEIASILKMDKSTVTKIISRLEQKNLVQETAFGESLPQGGRKRIFLEINGSFACVGGIHINTEQMIVCLADLCGTILFESVQKIDEDEYAKNGFSGILQDGIKLLQKNAERMRISIAGIGLGVPGIVDIENKKIIQSIPLLIEKPFDIAQAANEILDVPFFLENDARCCCYAERI
ncbi:MAG: ROK family transcriptional regulator [Treponemataceae bacterium]|nr:ROK family transcriptional regulator [Treponemataceae bacterium]